jgi:hypothetical protein
LVNLARASRADAELIASAPTLAAELTETKRQLAEAVGALEDMLNKHEALRRIGKFSTRLESNLALKRWGRAQGKARELVAAMSAQAARLPRAASAQGKDET